MKYAKKCSSKSYLKLTIDLVQSSITDGFSFHEYFYYGFYRKDLSVRRTYASMGLMYEFQLKNNPPKTRFILENKIIFLSKYSKFTKRGWLDLSVATLGQISNFINGKTKLVLKKATGGAGKNIKIIRTSGLGPQDLKIIALKNNFDLLEEFVIQHKDLMDLSPGALNTVRIITQINKKGGLDIIGTILRLSIEKETDNLSTGGIACPVDTETGVVCGPGISFDILKEDFYYHPSSGIKLIGFVVPYWNETLEMCRNAALLYPDNKSIGWDVAITSTGPLLIEGNHDWGARLWQMPVKKGLKYILHNYS